MGRTADQGDNGMSFPRFFDDAPEIRLRDPLAGFLGSAEDGVMTYRYADAVRLAGHSCPVVAGAWLMVAAGLARLYGDDLPERGGIEVHMRDAADHGTTGVTASVATLVTGAAAESGFGGIGPAGLFARRGLLRFGAPIDAVMALRRRDTGAGVMLDIDSARIPQDPEIAQLMPQAIAGRADASAMRRFGTIWQDRIARMLAMADDPALVRLREWPAT